MLELLIVIAILLIVAGMTAPKMLEIIDSQKLRSNAQAFAGLLQQARMRATQDDKPYQVLFSGNMAYVDLQQNQTYNSGGSNPDPAVQLDSPITVTDTGAPAGFDTQTLLSIIPLKLETSTMVSSSGNPSPGLAFNERGLPCQTSTAGAACTTTTTVGTPPQTTLVAWVTYLRYTNRHGGYAWAAVTVTPAGRIKVWTYQNTDATHGNWE